MAIAKLTTLASHYFSDASMARLKTIARQLINRERPGHTLQATSLVNECFLKLRNFNTPFLHEDHFYRTAARAMRQVLIDHARVRNHKKKLTINGLANALLRQSSGVGPRDHRFQFIWNDLQKLDPQMAETLWLRFVEGLTQDEIASAQSRASWKVRADLEYAQGWLKHHY